MTSPVEAMRAAGNDIIDRPSHYVDGRKNHEPINVLEEWFASPSSDPELSPLLWQVVKYLARCGRKGGRAMALQDLKKARWYLDRAIAREERR